MRTRHLDNDVLLYLSGVSVSFDGFKALNALSLTLGSNELRAVIGPNGAGKTTMMDVITGRTRPDAGEIVFDTDTDLTALDEVAIARLGIGRKFQKPSVIETLTVYENLELARAGGRSVWQALRHRRDVEQDQDIAEITREVGLSASEGRIAGALSHGQKQWLEIAMLLIQNPAIMLIDEPAAGMTDEETEKTAALFRKLAATRTVVVVEHDMEFIRALNCRVTVLHEGRVLAEGTLESVQGNQEVIDVYLGR